MLDRHAPLVQYRWVLLTDTVPRLQPLYTVHHMRHLNLHNTGLKSYLHRTASAPYGTEPYRYHYEHTYPEFRENLTTFCTIPSLQVLHINTTQFHTITYRTQRSRRYASTGHPPPPTHMLTSAQNNLPYPNETMKWNKIYYNTISKRDVLWARPCGVLWPLDLYRPILLI